VAKLLQIGQGGRNLRGIRLKGYPIASRGGFCEPSTVDFIYVIVLSELHVGQSEVLFGGGWGTLESPGSKRKAYERDLILWHFNGMSAFKPFAKITCVKKGPLNLRPSGCAFTNGSRNMPITVETRRFQLWIAP